MPWSKVPLVYLHALMPGKYLAAWPVFVIGEERRSLTFIVRSMINST